MSATPSVIPGQPNITFVMIKHDAIKNNAVAEIIDVLSAAGFLIIHREEDVTVRIPLDRIAQFYSEHLERPYFQKLAEGMMSGVIPIIVEYPDVGEPAWSRMRALIGITDSRKADPKTIRGQYGGHKYNRDAPMAENAIHASDSWAAVLREIKIIFPDLKTITSYVYQEFSLAELKLE